MLQAPGTRPVVVRHPASTTIEPHATIHTSRLCRLLLAWRGHTSVVPGNCLCLPSPAQPRLPVVLLGNKNKRARIRQGKWAQQAETWHTHSRPSSSPPTQHALHAATPDQQQQHHPLCTCCRSIEHGGPAANVCITHGRPGKRKPDRCTYSLQRLSRTLICSSERADTNAGWHAGHQLLETICGNRQQATLAQDSWRATPGTA